MLCSGGELKTLEQADKESMQAAWFSVDELDKIDLRAKDINTIIRQAVEYTNTPAEIRYSPVLPIVRPNKLLIWKCVLFMRDIHDAYHAIRVDKGKPSGFPAIVVLQKDRSTVVSVYRLLSEIFPQDSEVKVSPTIIGVLNVEFHGKPKHEHDGFTATLLIRLVTTTNERFEEPIPLQHALVWKKLDDAEVASLEKKIENPTGCIHLNAHN